MPSQRIFISYRRGADNCAAGRIFDLIHDEFGPDAAFLDVDAAAPSADFRADLRRVVAGCDVFLAVIGEGWRGGTERLANADDSVRVEIEAALAGEVAVIPVLVDGAAPPEEAALPSEIRTLFDRETLSMGGETCASAMGAKLIGPIRNRCGRRRRMVSDHAAAAGARSHVSGVARGRGERRRIEAGEAERAKARCVAGDAAGLFQMDGV